MEVLTPEEAEAKILEIIEMAKKLPTHEVHLLILRIFSNSFVWTAEMLTLLDKLAYLGTVESKAQAAQKQPAKEHHDRTNQSAHQDI